ncbi:MAG: ribonuclease P protein component [Parcubacteria group bacterium]
MLSKQKRIPRKLFKQIIEQSSGATSRPRFLHSKHFSVRFADFGGESARIAVSVSKKVSKSAVLRNRTRRRAYSSLRDSLPLLKAGLYLVSAKPGAEKLKGEALKLELEDLLSSL